MCWRFRHFSLERCSGDSGLRIGTMCWRLTTTEYGIRSTYCVLRIPYYVFRSPSSLRNWRAEPTACPRQWLFM